MNKVLIEKATGNQVSWIGSEVDAEKHAEIWYGSDWADRLELRNAEEAR